MPNLTPPIGTLSERFAILTPDPPSTPVVTLAQLEGRATGTTATPHGLASGDYVRIVGATPLAYNGAQIQILVTGALEFSYAIDPATLSPASGSITVDFQSDAQGGQGSGWWPAGHFFGALTALAAGERLQAEAIGSTVAYRVVTLYRRGLTPRMRLEWRPYLEPTPRALEIHGVIPHPAAPRTFLVIECGELA